MTTERPPFRLLERDVKVCLLACGLGNTGLRGALGPVLFIPVLAGRSQFTYLMEPLQRECAYGHFL